MLVGNIVEKPSSASPAPPPRPPSASSSFAHAFPPVLHRSQRPASSRFSSSGLKKYGESSTSSTSPAAGASAKAFEEMTEVERIRQSVEEENNRRVAEMTVEEREEEVKELKERFGPGLEALMRRRREQRNKLQGQEGPPSPTRSTGLASTSTPINSDENLMRVKAMSEEERRIEIQELEERFGSTVIDALRQRAVKKAQDGRSASAQPREPRTPTVRTTIPRPAEDLSQSELKAKYFPDLPDEPEKMAWLQNPLPTPEGDTSPRFDLSGRELSASDSKDLPSNIGLHHHGSSPNLAGYTVDEIIHLCQSTVTSQRITMMGVLSRLVSDYVAGKSSEAVKAIVVEKRICEQAINLAVGAILLMSKSAGVFRAGVDLFYEALGGSQWTYLDNDAKVTHFRPTESHVDLAAVAWEDVVPTFGEMLDTESLSPRTTNQIFMVLTRLAVLSEEHCELVTPLVPNIIRTHVLLRPWPAKENSTTPSSEALSLMAGIILSSRRCAAALVDQGIIEPLLKFPLTLTWDDTALGMQVSFQSLRIISSLARYGLATSIARSGSEPLDRLRQWLYTARAPAVRAAYFELLRNWIVCATDPHKTTPEHDLTWAQVSALGWADDVLELLGQVAVKRNHAELDELVRGLDVMVAWVEGSEINGVDKGSAEKKAVVDTFERLAIVDNVYAHWALENDDGFERIMAPLVRLHHLAGDILPTEKVNSYLGRQSTLNNPTLRYNLLRLASNESSPTFKSAQSVQVAFDTITAFQPGSEPVVLEMIDLILRSDLKSHFPDLDLDSLPSDGLQILRPLLQYTVLPDLTNIVGPTVPRPDYLKATSTLRPNVPPMPRTKREPGLPLSPSWLFSPLDELLHSASSIALAQTPPDWDPSELDLVRAVLMLARIRTASGLQSPGISRSDLLLNLMKVFMLEHGQQTLTNHSETDLFRDPTISASLKSLIALTLTAPITSPFEPINLEQACIAFLGPETPFFQWYTDFLALYESISFSDHAFTQLLLPPLAMSYPVDFRRLFWSEHTSILRGIRLEAKDVPLENERGLEVFYTPRETDQSVLDGMIRAAGRGWLKEGTFLSGVAVHHIRQMLWGAGDEEARKGLLVGVLSTCPDDIVKAVFRGAAGVGSDKWELVARLAGPRGIQRLDKLSL